MPGGQFLELLLLKWSDFDNSKIAAGHFTHNYGLDRHGIPSCNFFCVFYIFYVIFLVLFDKNAQNPSNLSNNITDFSDSTGKSLQTKNKTNEVVKTKGFVIEKLK